MGRRVGEPVNDDKGGLPRSGAKASLQATGGILNGQGNVVPLDEGGGGILIAGIIVGLKIGTDVEHGNAVRIAFAGFVPVVDFLFDLRVATLRGALVGFIVSRVVAAGESEVLNLAVTPEARNRGVANALLDEMTEPEVFLEVRESNTVARALYEKQGFRVVGRREDYYDDPVESALVMRRERHGAA